MLLGGQLILLPNAINECDNYLFERHTLLTVCK